MSIDNDWKKYLLGVIFMILMAFVGQSWASQNATNEMVVQQGQEIARLTAEYAAIMHRLERMDSKLDRLIEETYAQSRNHNAKLNQIIDETSEPRGPLAWLKRGNDDAE